MLKSGVLYWITGLSGAGKTTIGNRLYYELKKNHDNVVLLDGDILKKIVSSNPGYSRQDRYNRAMQYAHLCKSLTDQGLIVICCTIAMFEEVRKWNRAYNKGYVEIFINTPMSVLVKRDSKSIYSEYATGNIKNVVGKDIEIDFPKAPDIEIINDDENNLDDSVKKILEYEVVLKNDYSRDTIYWNEYYKNMKGDMSPSKFAEYVKSYVEKGKHMLELGCGNGRDSVYFLNNGLRITAIDASKIAIERLNETVDKSMLNNALFICDDFVCSSLMKTSCFDYIYSRFTLHAINLTQEDELIKNVWNALKEDGLLFIETRSTKDSIYGKGEIIEKNAFKYNNHFRRFIDYEEITTKLEKHGFIITYAEENVGFAPSEKEDPMIIRIICKKPKVK